MEHPDRRVAISLAAEDWREVIDALEAAADEWGNEEWARLSGVIEDAVRPPEGRR